MTTKFGRQGFCKVCNHPELADINKKVREGLNAAQLNRYTQERYGFTANRQTWYGHKPHADGLETAVVKHAATQIEKLEIKKTSNRSFLEAVRDIGYSKAITDPEQISIEHALKAASILEQSEKKSGGVINLLVAVSTGSYQPASVEVIDGESREIT